jgi:hypothetical protein
MNYVPNAPRKQWVETADGRHAIDAPPAHPGNEFVSFCQREIVVVAITPGQPAPECRACDHVWRELEGAPQRETYIPQPASEPTVRELAQLSHPDRMAVPADDDSTLRLRV